MQSRVGQGHWVVGIVVALGIGGCGAEPSAPASGAVDTDGVCPPEDPSCDRLDSPCVDDSVDDGTSGPGSSPLGLTTDLTAGGKYRTWPKGRVPYKINASLGETSKTRLLQAMSEWEKKTGGRVRFEPATSTDAPILIVSGDTLPITNQVGYRAGTNSTVKLRNPEPVTVIRHELGHVLGLNHEQKRADRLDYIQVKSENVVNTDLCKDQFKVCTDCVPILDYQIDSIMHYRTDDLANCRDGKVLLKKDGSDIGHTWVITAGDVAVIHELYGAPSADAGAGDAGMGGAGGQAGGGGDDGGIDTPDEVGGAGGTAGASGGASGGGSGSTGGAAAGGGASSGGAAGASQGDSGDDGGCSAATAPATGAHGLVALAALTLLGALGRRRRTARTPR